MDDNADLAGQKDVAPFIHTIRVSWSDCDPARIAYTGRIPYFSLEAIDAWWERHAGIDWYKMNVDRDVGTPFVHLSLDFRAPVTPRHPLVCEVRLLKIGNSSIRHLVRGMQNGILCFEGQFVSSFVVATTMKTRRPPADLLALIQPHLQGVEQV